MKLGKHSGKDEKKTDAQKIEERREEVLAQGRKFKYPLQWAKRQVVANTILISGIMMALLVAFGWFALYRFQMTNDVIYRMTTILPVSVAQVDGEKVLFADYLMFYRSSITSIEQQSGINNESYEELKMRYKRSALTEAEKYTYAMKLAKEKQIEVSDAEVDAEFEKHRVMGGVDRSEEGFLKILADNFNLSKNEYKKMIRLTLLKAKVQEEIDSRANATANKVEAMLESSNYNFEKVAEELGEDVVYEKTGGLVDNRNVDGGRSGEAMLLAPGQSSARFVSANGDGYYFVKLVAKTETEVNFESIKIPFTVFEDEFAGVQENGKITEFIELE